jgi:tetratricopeptide (TPR) repeat protein
MFPNKILLKKKNPGKITTTFSQKILLILLGLSFLIILEICLRFFCVLPVHKTEDPFLDFHGERPLFIPNQSGTKAVYTTNPTKLNFFNQQHFPIEKSDSTCRIFCLGGSTTFGRPFAAATSFPIWLKILLDEFEPKKSHEVINAGGISYASYRIVRLMREIANYQPDLFIVYTGHNEFLETVTYSNLLNRPRFLKHVVCTLDKTRIYRFASLTIRSLRKTIKKNSSGLPGEVEANLDRIGGFELYNRDKKLKHAILDQFSININRMIDISKEINVPILFVNPMSNLSDFSPFKSELTDGINPLAARKAEQQRKSAIDQIEMQNFTQAKIKLDQSVILDPDFAIGCYLRALCMENLGFIKESAKEYQKAIDLDVCPLRSIGEIRTILNEVTEQRGVALLSLDSVFVSHCKNGLLGNEMFMDHVHPTIFGHQIIALNIMKNLWESGIVNSTHALTNSELNSRNHKQIESLDRTYFAKGNLNLGKVLVWARKHAEALGPLKAAVKNLPENKEAQRLLANTFHRLGQYEKAAEEYQHVLKSSPKDVKAWANLCDVELHLKHIQRAIGAGKKAISLAPNNAKYHALLGDVFFQNNRLDSALDSYNKAVRLDSNNAIIHNNLGKIHLTLDNTAEAIRTFQSAIRLDSTYTLAYKNLGKCYSSLDKHDQAADAYRQACKLSPLDEQSCNMLGITYLRGGKLSSAAKEFYKVLIIDSTVTEAHQNLATAYAMSGKPDSGLYHQELALFYCPPGENQLRAEILANLGNLAVLTGNLTRAITVWQECLKILPKNFNVLHNIAYALIRKEKTETTIGHLKKAHALQPKNQKILIMLGESLTKLNRKEEARVYFEKVKMIESSLLHGN